MKVTIFGASSMTGRHLVEKALEQGHLVTAFVRDADKLEIKHENLSIVVGDALNSAAVERAIQGADAVLSTIGPKGKPTAMVAESTQNMVAAMKKLGVRRLVVVSVGGVFQPGDRPNGLNKLISGLIKLLQREIFADREKQLSILQDGDLDWVAVRVPRLLNGPATGKVSAGYWGPDTGLSLTRADLADFMLAQLNEDTWLSQAPVVSNGR